LPISLAPSPSSPRPRCSPFTTTTVPFAIASTA